VVNGYSFGLSQNSASSVSGPLS